MIDFSPLLAIIAFKFHKWNIKLLSGVYDIKRRCY